MVPKEISNMHECSSPASGYKTTTCGIATWFQCTSLVSGRVRVHMLPALFTSVGKLYVLRTVSCQLMISRIRSILCPQKSGTPMTSPLRALSASFVVHMERFIYA